MYPQYIWVHPHCLIYNWMDASTIYIWIHPCCLIYNRMDVSTVPMDTSTLLNYNIMDATIIRGYNHVLQKYLLWIHPCYQYMVASIFMDVSRSQKYGSTHLSRTQSGCIHIVMDATIYWQWIQPFIDNGCIHIQSTNMDASIDYNMDISTMYIVAWLYPHTWLKFNMDTTTICFLDWMYPWLFIFSYGCNHLIHLYYKVTQATLILLQSFHQFGSKPC